MKESTKRRLKFLGGFSVYFGALWLLWDTPAVYPLKVFVVLLHEISHGLVAVATGGFIEKIVLDPQQGGACYCPGGNPFFTLSAGYLGSLLWGAGLLTVAQSRRIKASWVTTVIGVMVVGLSLLYVRSSFGLAFSLAFGALLIVASRQLSVVANRSILLVLGLTSCLYAILDIKSDVLDRPHLPSDAHMLSDLTGVPTMIWGVLWIGLAVFVAGWLFRRAYQNA